MPPLCRRRWMARRRGLARRDLQLLGVRQTGQAHLRRSGQGRPSARSAGQPGATPRKSPAVSSICSTLPILLGRQPTVVRELLPRGERTKSVPEQRYRLKPMPFATFGELQRLGLVLEVWCSTRKSSRPVTIGADLAACRFGRGRFTCRAQRHNAGVWGCVIPIFAGRADRLRGSVRQPHLSAVRSALEREPYRAGPAPLDNGSDRHRRRALSLPGVRRTGSDNLMATPAAAHLQVPRNDTNNSLCCPRPASRFRTDHSCRSLKNPARFTPSIRH